MANWIEQGIGTEIGYLENFLLHKHSMDLDSLVRPGKLILVVFGRDSEKEVLCRANINDNIIRSQGNLPSQPCLCDCCPRDCIAHASTLTTQPNHC